MEWKHPSIIAMKGYPYTGKTSIAFTLTKHLRFCLLLRLDDILDSITPSHYSSAAPPPPPEADHLNTRAFDILCGLVENQLRVGVSVIVDSLPLSRPHLDRLVALSQSSNSTKLIIVECLIERAGQYAWRKRFEQPSEKAEKWSPYPDEDRSRWYKPRIWEDVEKLVKLDCDKRDEPVPGVSRLLVNVGQIVNGRHLILAIQALVFCQDDRHVDYQKWSEYNMADDHHTNRHGEKELMVNRRRPLITERVRFCESGHSITVYKQEGLSANEYEADCGICEKPVLGAAAYACSNCELTLHKPCAEKRSIPPFAPHEFPTFIRKPDTTDHDPSYSFPENFACLLCREAGEGFSEECSSCVFETHLKCGLVPTIIEHDGHQHKLHFWAIRVSSRGGYRCAACGKAGAYAAYSCNGCEMGYHVECALLPYPIRDHLHGGYKHTLDLRFWRDEELEEYPCDNCLQMMNPEDWYYHCRICPQTYHLKCAFMKDDE